MIAKDLMNQNPVVAEIPTSRQAVLRLLVKHNLPALPLVKAGTKRLAGIITRDKIFEQVEEEQIALLMEPNPITIKSSEGLKAMASLIWKHGCRILPVVDQQMNLIGLITPTKLLELLIENSEPIKRYMRSQCVPIYEETPLPVVMKIFSLTKVDALPVLDQNTNLVGLVTEGDLFNVARIDERVAKSELGMGEDEDQWTWEGMRDLVQFYYATSRIDLPLVPAKEVMVKRVVSASRQTKVGEVANKMLRYNISQLPVLDESNKLAGVIDELDLMKAFD
jgi:CBS domain-containing protein